MNEFYNKIKYFEEEEMKPARVYYHYTSLDALYKIVSTKTFRLTSLKSSNDEKELCYKPETFLEDFIRIQEHECDDRKKYLTCIAESIQTNKLEFNKKCREKGYPYALCLSKKKDNLTHWDRYADACAGVCIGFNVSALDVLMQRMAVTVLGKGMYDVGQILYEEQQKEDAIKTYFLNILDPFIKQEKIKADYQSEEILRKNGYLYAASVYNQITKFVKDQAFVDEDEVRFYHDAISIKNMMYLLEVLKANIEQELYFNLKMNLKEFITQLHLADKEQFYISSRGIRSYKNLCLSAVWGSGTIPEIILGPMCVQNRSELRRFLKASGLEGTKVTVSSVPIR